MAIDVGTFFGAGGPISGRLEGYEVRSQQQQMADAVAAALESRGNLIVEAPTGVGKSFAYLIPAIHRIIDHRERVVVVTNTINLQEQLLEKDIPLLNAVIPDEFTAVLVKGRSNYISLRRLQRASERQDRLFSDAAARQSLHAIEDWAYETDDGTLTTLPQLERMDVWDHVLSDASNCMGRKCPSHDVCFFQMARRRMEHSQLLICNHALFFSDLALRSKGVGFLPAYDHVILDEAHCMEDVASEHFGVSLSESRVNHLLRTLYHPKRHTGVLSTLQMRQGASDHLDQLIALVLRSFDDCTVFFNDVADWLKREAPSNGRMNGPAMIGDTLSPRMSELSKRLRLLREDVESEQDGFELGSLSERASDIASSVQILLEQKLDGCVYWAEATASRGPARRGARRERISMKCMAVDVAPILREQLFESGKGVVLTSATMTTGPQGFDHVRGRLGCEDAETLQLDSPFHFAEQMRVIVDPSMPEPNDASYMKELCVRLRAQIDETGGGVFILFTSMAMLHQAADALSEDLTDCGYPVLVQGRGIPPTTLLERFRSSGQAVLFGTGRFWQGVDVRGDALRSVIVTRLPFAVPTQPLVEARHELIKKRGGNPFAQDQIPHAVIRFKQGIGRLIRSSEDEGRIVILDSRVMTKPYGRTFLQALPEGVAVEDGRESSMFDDGCSYA